MIYRKKMNLFVIILLALALTACSTNPQGGSGEGEETIADSDSEQIVLRIMDWSDSSKVIREQFHKQFEARHPNIKIEYTQLTIDQFNSTVLTAIQSGEAPDLFPVPPTMKLSTAVSQGWFQPLDPFIDDSFKNSLVEGTFTEGTTMLNGNIYTIPEGQSLPTTLVFYNKKLFKEAGLDPEHPPKTYSEFREAARKITEAGKGEYYGIIEGGKQMGRWTAIVQDWSSLGGSGLTSLSPVSLVTKTTAYDSEPVKQLFQLFQNLAEDGSYHPQTPTISAPEARALFAQEKAGFIVQGSWNVGVWNSQAPSLDYGVMAPPVPDSGRKGSIPLNTASPWLSISAQSEHPQEAGLYLKELFGNSEYQQKMVESGIGFSVVKGVTEQYTSLPQLKDYYDLSKEFGRIAPNPIVRNSSTGTVFENFKDVKPNAGELLGATVSKAISNPAESLTKLSVQMNEAWTAAIEAARAKGTDVSAEDFLFPNWDPYQDYKQQDYVNLP
ncbi:ABC transporter substrate-binding protein [Paenibacillus xylanexedens]|uniref:ABC transporter substrate-binding protein n=1 Tax=Paenibacillus xylanexedens TaxID=528191 RepID=UPI0011A9B9E5|nr:sugar ABC transporter substrate-binding protein [Paenibacillus xylanexedens]